MTKLRILIVEDEAITAADLHHQLTVQGYAVIGTAVTTAEALRLAEAEKPDLVLMDINIEGSHDGVIAASALRGLEIPVIFLTAHYDSGTLARAKLTTPVGYLTKPFDPHQLAVAIEVGMERHRSDAERIRLVRALEEERARVKILRGLLSICSSCQKIRGDDGDWQSLESYLDAHSEATLSQGCCPACAIVIKHVKVGTAASSNGAAVA